MLGAVGAQEGTSSEGYTANQVEPGLKAKHIQTLGPHLPGSGILLGPPSALKQCKTSVSAGLLAIASPRTWAPRGQGLYSLLTNLLCYSLYIYHPVPVLEHS